MIKIAITGASGFIGQHVLRAFADIDADVTVMHRSLPQQKNLAQHFKLMRVDLAEPGKNLFTRLGRPDVLLHMAWGGLPHYRSTFHFETEAPRHYSFLKSLCTDGLQRVVVTGTCFEYGMQSGPLGEMTPCRPSTSYGFAKDTLRRQLEFLREQLSFDLTWARLFYTFGEGQAANSLWSQLNNAVLSGELIFQMSGGEQIRDYLPVTDVAEALVRLTIIRSGFDVVNICSGRPQSVRNLVEHWLEKYNWKITPIRGVFPYPDYEPFAFWGVPDRLNAVAVR